MSTEQNRVVFDPRMINVTKLSKEVDCEITAKECEFAIAEIGRQMQTPGFGDADWKASAAAAARELAQRRDMALMKLAAIKADKEKFREKTPEDKFNSRFLTAARAILPRDIYGAVFAAASASSTLLAEAAE